MKAVVTGGAGFIGSHLVDSLIAEGWEVHVIDNLTSGRKEQVHQAAKFYPLDVRSAGAKKIIAQEKPDVVFHLAAQVDVQASILDPKADADINILGMINILEACVDGAVKKVVFASSCAVYGNLQKPLLHEQDATEPVSYYGISKLSSEMYIVAFQAIYGIDFTILRFANVYGPKQSKAGEGGVVAIFLDRIRNQLPLTIYGDGTQTRDFIFVEDIVAALMAAGLKGSGKTFNIGTSQSTSVNDMATQFQRLSNFPLEVNYVDKRKGDIQHSCVDNSLAVNELEWTPQYDLATGLEKTYYKYFS